MSGDPVELVPVAHLVERLGASGLAPALIAEASGIPITQVQVLLRRARAATPEDEELARQWASIEREALRFIRQTYRRGTQTDKMTLTKIIAGRLLAKRVGGDEDGQEEMRITWQEIREEQRAVKLVPDNVRAFPSQLDYDEDVEE